LPSWEAAVAEDWLGKWASVAQPAIESKFALPPDIRQAAYRLLAAAVICLALALSSDAFLTAGNLLNVLRQTALLFLLASGLTLVILTAGLDLSVGANVALSACLAASVIKGTGFASLGFLTGIGCGALMGLINVADRSVQLPTGSAMMISGLVSLPVFSIARLNPLKSQQKQLPETSATETSWCSSNEVSTRSSAWSLVMRPTFNPRFLSIPVISYSKVVFPAPRNPPTKISLVIDHVD
jgi:hypothetical protein